MPVAAPICGSSPRAHRRRPSPPPPSVVRLPRVSTPPDNEFPERVEPDPALGQRIRGGGVDLPNLDHPLQGELDGPHRRGRRSESAPPLPLILVVPSFNACRPVCKILVISSRLPHYPRLGSGEVSTASVNIFLRMRTIVSRCVGSYPWATT